MSIHHLGVTVATVAITIMAGCLGGCGEVQERYVIVSGSQSGVYYPTAAAMARLAREVHPDLRIDVRTSGGSVGNARMIADGSAHLALIQNDIAAYALAGELMFQGQKLTNIRGVAGLYPEHIQIVAHAAAGVRSVADLRGKRVAIGAIGSGTEANAVQVLEAYGLKEADLGGIERLSASESRDYLQDRRVDAAFFTFGVGTAAIQELALVSDIVFLPVEGEVRDRLIERYPFYTSTEIPAGAYRNQTDAVPTVAVTATLVAGEDVSAELVESVLEGIFNHIESFRQTHDRLRGVNLEQARATLTLPLHPGAERFYGRSRE